MRVTVAICTWNRSDLLRQSLEQLTRLEIPADTQWELLVVNNRCTDATDDVIAELSTNLPLRRLYEPAAGLSHARNAVVREATGDYILWTDDDALVDPGWLASYIDAFRSRPQAAVFGGPVLPQFASTPPIWIERGWPLIADAYAARDLGPDALQFDGDRLMPFGANWAIRRREQARFRYDPRLGVRERNLGMGEETALIKELLAAGFEGWWVPEARVKHCIQAWRMTTRHLRRYYVSSGRHCAMTEPSDGPTILGRPRWAWRRALTSEARYLATRWRSPPEVWLPHLIAASRALGYLIR